MLLIAVSTVMSYNDAYAQKGIRKKVRIITPKPGGHKGTNRRGTKDIIREVRVQRCNDSIVNSIKKMAEEHRNGTDRPLGAGSINVGLTPISRNGLFNDPWHDPLGLYGNMSPLSGTLPPHQRLRTIVEKPKVLQNDKATMDKLAKKYIEFGTSFYKNQIYELAFLEFKRAAEYGDPEAEYYLGKMYYEGNGTEKSYEKAYEHYVEAAKKDLQNAHYELGWMHYSGKGCEKSHEMALKHFIKAAECGHVWAQYYAARMFCDGKGTPESREDAIKWFTKAAAQGLEEAKASIGYCVEGK